MQILSRRTKNNPVLIANPAWARQPSSASPRGSSSNQVPELLKGKQIYTLDLAALVAG